jgi:signal transduction histidine kinase
VNSLIALINDLLDIEQMDAGKLQIKVSETMVQDLFERTTWALESFAFQHGVKLAFQATELEFSFDAARIEQVLINLISNAIKFSSSGTVINLEAHEDGDAVEILVIDQGRGIPEEERPFIFDRFRQVEALDAKRGSGLGLAICKLIVESHSGAIGVRTPSSGKGSEFWLRLPYVKEA